MVGIIIFFHSFTAGKISMEKSYIILQQRLQPAYRKHKILSIRYTVAVAAGFVLLIVSVECFIYQRPVRTLIVSNNKLNASTIGWL